MLAVAKDVVLLPSVSSVFAIVETVLVGIGVFTIAAVVAAAAGADAGGGTNVDAMAVVTRGVSIAFIFLFEFTLSAVCICTPSTGDATTPAAGRLNDACAIFVPFVKVFASELDVCGTFDLLQY